MSTTPVSTTIPKLEEWQKVILIQRAEIRVEVEALEAERKTLKGQLSANGARLHTAQTRLHTLEETEARLQAAPEAQKPLETQVPLEVEPSSAEAAPGVPEAVKMAALGLGPALLSAKSRGNLFFGPFFLGGPTPTARQTIERLRMMNLPPTPQLVIQAMQEDANFANECIRGATLGFSSTNAHLGPSHGVIADVLDQISSTLLSRSAAYVAEDYARAYPRN